MSKSIQLNDDVQAVCAPDPNTDYSGKRSQVSGWGNTQTYRQAKPQRKFNVVPSL